MPCRWPNRASCPIWSSWIKGGVPNKCSTCNHLFEGGCSRNMELTQRYLHLDHGPCGIPGPTDPVFYEDNFIQSKVEVPRKCHRCVYLFHDSIEGFTCKKDADKRGDFHRGLDWGHWSPRRLYVELPHPKITTRALIDCLHKANLVEFIQEYRKINPASSIVEAKEDYAYLNKNLKILSEAQDSA